MKHLSVGEGTGLGFELARLRLERQDAERRAYLDARVKGYRRDPDERPENDPPPACEVCGVDAPRALRGPKVRAAVICRECSAKGWRSRRCACGALLRTWDIGPPGWHKSACCRACRNPEAA